MLIVRPNTTTRIPVRLTDGFGVAVTGRTPTDVLSGVATLVKADGTTVDVTLLASGGGQNWFEVNSVKAPGLYHVVVPGADFTVVGPSQLFVLPSASAFVPVADSFLVEDFSLSSAIWDAPRSAHVAVGSYGDVMRLLFLVLAGHVKLDATAGTQTVYQENNTDIFHTQTLKDANGAAAGLNATERLAAVRPV